MRKCLLFLLLVSPAVWCQSAQLVGPVASSDSAFAEAAKAVQKTGLRDVQTFPKQSFAVRWNGMLLGTFLSLGARTPESPYQCLHIFVPADPEAVPSLVVTAGAGKLGATICDRPRAVGVLRSPTNQIRVGILYANSEYLDGKQDTGVDAPPVSAAVTIDPKTRTMTIDAAATEILQKAAPSTLPEMRGLF